MQISSQNKAFFGLRANLQVRSASWLLQPPLLMKLIMEKISLKPIHASLKDVNKDSRALLRF